MPQPQKPQPRQNVPQKPKPTPSQPIKSKAEAMPKLKPVERPAANKPLAVSRPKTAVLPPSGPLKPLQPIASSSKGTPTAIKQKKTSSSDAKELFPRYDYVGTPQQSQVNAIVEEIYAVPMKDKSQSVEDLSVQKSTAIITEDVYQVPGEVRNKIILQL